MTRTRPGSERRSIDVFRDLGGKSSVVTLDGAKDPDDFFRVKTQAEFNERLDAALLDVAFIYEARRSVDPSSIEGKIRIRGHGPHPCVFDKRVRAFFIC